MEIKDDANALAKCGMEELGGAGLKFENGVQC